MTNHDIYEKFLMLVTVENNDFILMTSLQSSLSRNKANGRKRRLGKFERLLFAQNVQEALNFC